MKRIRMKSPFGRGGGAGTALLVLAGVTVLALLFSATKMRNESLTMPVSVPMASSGSIYRSPDYASAQVMEAFCADQGVCPI